MSNTRHLHRMKISEEAFAQLDEAISPLDTDTIRQDYRMGAFERADRVRDLDKRYRWDLFWHAARSHPEFYDLFADLTDIHIDTALRAIVAPL